jgi:hypothetical protein
MDHTEALKSMLQDVINDKMEQASVTMHDYFVSKTREVTGLAASKAARRVESPAFESTGDSEDVLNAVGMSLTEFKALSKAEKSNALKEAVNKNPDLSMAVLKFSRENSR